MPGGINPERDGTRITEQGRVAAEAEREMVRKTLEEFLAALRRSMR